MGMQNDYHFISLYLLASRLSKLVFMMYLEFFLRLSMVFVMELSAY